MLSRWLIIFDRILLVVAR